MLIEEILKAVKRTDNKLEKIEEKLNKLENIMINIEIQQNTHISIGKDPKYVKGTTGKIVEQIIFMKYRKRTIKWDDIEKRSLDEKLLEQILRVRKKKKKKRRKTSNRKRNYRRISQINENEIENIMIEIQVMNLDETEDVNLIGHIRGPNKIKEEYPKPFERQHKLPNYEQLGNAGAYLDIDC